MSVCFSFPHCRPFLLSRIEVFTEPIVRVRPSLPQSVIGLSCLLLCTAVCIARSLSDPLQAKAKRQAVAGGQGAERERRRADGWGGEGRGEGGGTDEERTRTDTTRRRRTAGARSRAPSPLAKNPSGGARFPRAFLDQGSRSNGVCTVHCALWVGRRDNNV